MAEIPWQTLLNTELPKFDRYSGANQSEQNTNFIYNILGGMEANERT